MIVESFDNTLKDNTKEAIDSPKNNKKEWTRDDFDEDLLSSPHSEIVDIMLERFGQAPKLV